MISARVKRMDEKKMLQSLPREFLGAGRTERGSGTGCTVLHDHGGKCSVGMEKATQKRSSSEHTRPGTLKQ